MSAGTSAVCHFARRLSVKLIGDAPKGRTAKTATSVPDAQTTLAAYAAALEIDTAMLTRLGGDEDFFTALQGISQHVFAFGGEFIEHKTCRFDAIADIGAVIANMIGLAVMALAFLGRGNAGIFVSPGPALDDGQHDQRNAARLQHAIDFLERLRIVDMLEHVRADDTVIACVRNGDGFDVEHAVGAPGHDIGGFVTSNPPLQERRQSRFRREVQHIRVAQKTAMTIEPERQQPIALRRTAFRTARIDALGLTRRLKSSL